MSYRLHDLQISRQYTRYVSRLIARLLHVETPSKAEISKDVKHEVGDLMGHVNRVGPPVVLAFLLAQQFDPAIHIAVDEGLCTAQGGFRERIV
jgi:hypothetical protein